MSRRSSDPLSIKDIEVYMKICRFWEPPLQYVACSWSRVVRPYYKLNYELRLAANALHECRPTGSSISLAFKIISEHGRRTQNSKYGSGRQEVRPVQVRRTWLTTHSCTKQPSPRRTAYCIPHGPPPQLFVLKIVTYLSTSALSTFA